MNRIVVRISHRVLCAGFLSAGLYAQAPANRPPDKPASPASLPGDTLPPFGMLDASGNLTPQPQRPPRKGPPPAPRGPVNTRGPAIDLAIEAARTAVDTCAAGGFYIGASVIDTSGQPRAMIESDGSDGGHVYVGVRKALVALAFKMPSSQAAQAVRDDKTLVSKVTPNMFVMEGAVPLMVGNEIIGAIGASGAAGENQDEICAIAGLNKIKSRLK